MPCHAYTWAHGFEELRARGADGWEAVPGSFYRHFHYGEGHEPADSHGDNCSAQLMKMVVAAPPSTRVTSPS